MAFPTSVNNQITDSVARNTGKKTKTSAQAKKPKKTATSVLRVEIRNRADHRLLLLGRDFGIDWQGQHFAAGAFGFGKISRLVSQAGKRGLQVQRIRIVNLRSYSHRLQVLPQLIALLCANHILIIDMAALRRSLRHGHPVLTGALRK